MQGVVEKVFFLLLRYEFGEELKSEIENLLTAEIMPSIFKLAKKHDLAHLIGDALEKIGYLKEDSESRKHFLTERNLAVFRYEQMQFEYNAICKVFESEKIYYLPLKGAIIKNIYPNPWMRTSCDIDILVKKENLDKAVNALKLNLNYEKKGESKKDVSLFSPSGVHLELHFGLDEGYVDAKKYLNNVWQNVEILNGYQCKMNNEIFYLYYIVHMASHFKIGGCGVRSFLDLYLIEKTFSFKAEREKMLKKCGLLEFEKAIKKCAFVWFGKASKTTLTNQIKDYILNAGMYGDIKNKVAIEQAKKGSKAKHLFSKIFVPYSLLKEQYPILEKYKILMPIYQVVRWFRLIFGKDSKGFRRELKAIKSVDEVRIAQIDSLFKKLKL